MNPISRRRFELEPGREKKIDGAICGAFLSCFICLPPPPPGKKPVHSVAHKKKAKY